MAGLPSFCPVTLVGLADLLASPLGYHFCLRIVVHLGHVLGIHILLVVEEEGVLVCSTGHFPHMLVLRLHILFSSPSAVRLLGFFSSMSAGTGIFLV